MNEKKTISISTQKYLLWIILIAVIVRILLMIILQSWEFDGTGSYGHRAGEIGSALASGQGFSWPQDSSYVPDNAIKKTSWESPVYPLIFTATFKIFGIYSTASAVVLIVFQIILSALGCILVFFISRRIFNGWVGLIAALIFALYPAGIHYSIQKIQTTYLIVILLLLSVFLLIELASDPTLWKNIFVGVTFGIAILTDPTIMAFFPLALIWLLVKGDAKRKTRIGSAALILLAVCVINLPWQIRNYAVLGQSFLVKSNFSRELFMGNYGNAAAIAEEQKYMSTLDEGERSKLYQKKALDSILKNPEQLIRQTFNRFVLYWTATSHASMNREKKASIEEQISGISYLIILVLGLAGLCLTLLRAREVQLIVLAILTLPIPYYLTWFARFRYRFPVETILIVFAGYAIFLFWKLLKRNKPAIGLK